MTFVLTVSVIEFVLLKVPLVVLLWSLKSRVDDIPAIVKWKLDGKEDSELDKKQWNLENVGTEAEDNTAKQQQLGTKNLLKEDDVMVGGLDESHLNVASDIAVASSSSSSSTRVLSPKSSVKESGNQLVISSDKQESPKKE